MAPESAPDPFALLEQDHRDVERWLDELSGAGSDEERQTAVGGLQQVLSVHFDFEESEIYPLVARLIGAPQADHCHGENDAVRAALVRLDPLPEDASYQEAMADLRTAVARHVQAAEKDVFPRLRDDVGLGEQEHLGAALQALREAAR